VLLLHLASGFLEIRPPLPARSSFNHRSLAQPACSTFPSFVLFSWGPGSRSTRRADRNRPAPATSPPPRARAHGTDLIWVVDAAESPPALDPSISNISIATRSPPKSSLGRHDGTHTTESPTRFLSRHASVGQAASITKSRPLPAWNSVTVVVVGCKRTIASRPRCLRLAPPANPTTTDFERLPLAAGHLSLPAPRFRHEPPTRPIPYPPRPPRIQHQPLFFSITSKTLSHF
jgi:hypothetical protein